VPASTSGPHVPRSRRNPKHRVISLPLRTLSTRIALPAGLLALAGVTVLSLILIRGQRHQALDEVIKGSESLAEVIRLSINHGMIRNDRNIIRETIAEVGRHEGIEVVRLFNKEGRISYSSRPDEVGRTVDPRSDDPRAAACISCHQGPTPVVELDPADRSRLYASATDGPILATILVIRNEEGCQGGLCHGAVEEQSVLGVLDVATSFQPAQARLSAATWNAAIWSLVAVGFITGALFLLVWHTVHRPVSRMIAATRRVTRGDLSQQVPSEATGEIGFLASSFNEMIESLNSSTRHLEEWATSLEATVAHKAEELRAARFQVAQAEKLSSVGLVAAGIAHELNSPLMAIITFAHLVKSSLPAGSQAHQDIDMITKEANRCAAIIRQLLDFSREQAAEASLEPCSVRKAIDGALEILKVEIRNQNVRVEVDVPEDLPLLEANGQSLMQVFVNLVLNAVQAMPGGGDIGIQSRVVPRASFQHVKLPPHPSPDLVRISVKDNGPGIPPESLRKVFDPFFTTKPVGEGSGLGLAVSLGLVQRYRGTMLAHSDGKDGTEFVVLLPVPEPTPASQADS